MMTRVEMTTVVVGAETRVVIIPRGYKQDHSVPPVILGHGHSLAAQGPYATPPAVGFGWAALEPYMRLGIPMCIIDAGGANKWNSDAAVQLMEDARAWMVANYSAKDGPAHIFGFSMGGTLAATYAAAHPDKTKTLVLACPGLDIVYLHDSNFNAYGKAELETAIGGGTTPGFTAALPNKDPMELAQTDHYDNLPILIYHAAPDDTALPLASANLFAANTGAEIHRSTTHNDHNPDVIDPVRLDSWLREKGIR